MLNFKHLHYFWVVAKTGGIVRAGQQLHITPQTLSGQIKLLEDRIGTALFRKSGRKLELTEAGTAALRYADDIFALGDELEAALRRDAAQTPALVFRVGISDSVPKTIAYRLVEPALDLPQPVRMQGEEGKMADLLARLAVHQLDLVVADTPLPAHFSVRAYNHHLGRSGLSVFASPSLAKKARGAFPQSLSTIALLMPGSDSALRSQFEQWLRQLQIQAHTVAEFDDSALMTAFGRQGRGAFVAPSVMEPEIEREHGVQCLGRCEDVAVDFYAISVQRRITHPCVAAITQSARNRLFMAGKSG
ncbi:transcriptional activator NhaR [Thiomonas sp.]